MVRVDSLWGFAYYYRCTADGRIQRSDNAKNWRIPATWRGKRADMSKATIAEIEVKIARQLDNPDSNFGAYVVEGG